MSEEKLEKENITETEAEMKLEPGQNSSEQGIQEDAQGADQNRALTVEDAFARIRELLSEMEKDDATLEKTFENYEEGMKLIRYCNESIDRVEKKVRKMNDDGSVSDFE